MKLMDIMNDLTGNDPLTSSLPVLSEMECVDIASRWFGLIQPTARLLTAERDLNLLVTALDGRQYVMKVSNAAEAPEATRFQTDALCHVETTAPDLPIPRVTRTLDGSTEARVRASDGQEHTVRLLSFLSGQPLYTASHSSTQRRNLAACLARLDLALESYHPSFCQEDLSWNIVNLLRLEPLLVHMEEERRNVVTAVMERFSHSVSPALSSLRRQVIYNDLNFHNVLVDEHDSDRISGIIDFGDIVQAPLVNDVAIACSYQFGEATDPLVPVGEFIAAYHAKLPLTAAEIEVLPTLIAARLATTVLITGWRARQYPHNSTYILRNNPLSWAGLHVLAGRSDSQLQAWARSCCGMEN